MTTTPITISGMPPSLVPQATPPSTPSGGASFGQLVDRFLQGAANDHQSAEAAVRDLATGASDNLHGVLLQVAQADLSFRLILEIRNRLSDAYQEIMKMQV